MWDGSVIRYVRHWISSPKCCQPNPSECPSMCPACSRSAHKIWLFTAANRHGCEKFRRGSGAASSLRSFISASGFWMAVEQVVQLLGENAEAGCSQHLWHHHKTSKGSDSAEGERSGQDGFYGGCRAGPGKWAGGAGRAGCGSECSLAKAIEHTTRKDPNQKKTWIVLKKIYKINSCFWFPR